MKVPGLDERIAAHADAVMAGDERAAESFVIESARGNWRSAASATIKDRPRDFELLACAKIGRQFMAKTRFHATNGGSTFLIRWKGIDGTWMIADVEDITSKRSPWSDIQHYEMERRSTDNA